MTVLIAGVTDQYSVPKRPNIRYLKKKHLEICSLTKLIAIYNAAAEQVTLIHTVDGSEIPNNHLGCMKPCK